MGPAVDGGDDLVRVDGPGEGRRVAVGFDEVAVDSGLEVDKGSVIESATCVPTSLT